MKILIFTENYYKGGLDTFIINLINSWPHRDDFYIMSNKDYPGLETIIRKTILDIRFLEYSNWQKKISEWNIFLKYISKLLKFPIFLPFYVLYFFILFRKLKFDRLLVVNGGYPGSFLCCISVISWIISGNKNKPIFSFHNSALKIRAAFSLIENLMDLIVITCTGKFVGVSKDCAESLKIRNFFSNSSKVGYIYNGISDPKAEMDPQILGSYDPFTCVMLSTFERRKGHIHLFNAVKLVILEFPNFRLNIYGQGSLEELSFIKEYIERNELSGYVFINNFSVEKEALIAGSALLVVPSQAFESFGLTALEAMALGVPVVTTDVGGLPEVVGDVGAGFVCRRESIEDFAKAIKSILRSPDLRNEMGAKGRERYLSLFSASRMAASYAALVR